MQYLIYLILLPSVDSFRVRWRPQVEFRVTEIPITIHVVQAFPHHLLFCKKALVCHQQVKLTLYRRTRKTCKTKKKNTFYSLSSRNDTNVVFQ